MSADQKKKKKKKNGAKDCEKKINHALLQRWGQLSMVAENLSVVNECVLT